MVDTKEVLIGNISENLNVSGATSLNEGFIAISEDYIKHDIYIMQMNVSYPVNDFVCHAYLTLNYYIEFE